jgi:predicted hotdog family 3-hydroxylacyl-ACP dehydratase
MKPSDYNILELIPQRPPITMIDALTHADERSATGILRITESNLFCDRGFLGEPGLIEFIAQTAAAYTGYKNKLEEGDVKEGYIGAIKDLEIIELPLISTIIESEITIENEIVGFTILHGRVSQGEKLLAKCEMRILNLQAPLAI